MPVEPNIFGGLPKAGGLPKEGAPPKLGALPKEGEPPKTGEFPKPGLLKVDAVPKPVCPTVAEDPPLKGPDGPCPKLLPPKEFCPKVDC